jgi:hypothetical protein
MFARRVWLCSRWRGLHLRRCLRVWYRLPHTSRSQHKALLEQGETGAAKHLALEQFQARDLTLHWPTTPGQRDPGFDRVVIILESFGKALEGAHRTLRGTGQPGLSLLGLPPAHKLDNVLGKVDRLGHFSMLGVQLGELLGFVLGALLLMPHHQPGRLTSGEEPVVGLGHDREGRPRPPLPRCVAVGLGRETSAVLGTVLALIILALLPQVGPYAEADETSGEDTGAR